VPYLMLLGVLAGGWMHGLAVVAVAAHAARRTATRPPDGGGLLRRAPPAACPRARGDRVGRDRSTPPCGRAPTARRAGGG
jgi:hypothetical protein